MEQKHVQIVGVQALQAAVYSFQNMLLGEIIVSLADAALALQNHLFPDLGVHAHRFGKEFLAVAVPIDVRVVKHIDAGLHGRADQVFGPLLVQVIDAHTAHNDIGGLQVGAGNLQIFHHENFLSSAVFPLS